MGRNYKDFRGDKNPNYRHGYGAGHPLTVTWQNMKSRCNNPNHKKFHRYGGRGITVCDEWMTSVGFIKWAELSGYTLGMTIDRINIDDGYHPDNCQWVTLSDNSRRKRTTKLTMEQANQIRKRVHDGENESDLAKEFGVVHGTVWFIKNNFTHVADGECCKKIKGI